MVEYKLIFKFINKQKDYRFYSGRLREIGKVLVMLL